MQKKYFLSICLSSISRNLFFSTKAISYLILGSSFFPSYFSISLAILPTFADPVEKQAAARLYLQEGQEMDQQDLSNFDHDWSELDSGTGGAKQ